MDREDNIFNIYYCTNRICIKIIRKVRVQTIHLKTSSLHDLTPANLSVIVAPHPDDEVFGCCGLMQRLIAQGKRVELIIMTGVVKVMLAVVTLMKAS